MPENVYKCPFSRRGALLHGVLKADPCHLDEKSPDKMHPGEFRFLISMRQWLQDFIPRRQGYHLPIQLVLQPQGASVLAEKQDPR